MPSTLPYSRPHVYLDHRVGSIDLEPHLRRLGVDVTVQELDSADVAWEGNGPNGRVLVGLERKTISDAIQSMRTGRFSHKQLIDMLKDYDHCELLVEGSYKADEETGDLMVPSRAGWVRKRLGAHVFSARVLDQWLYSLQIQTGCVVMRTHNAIGTAMAVRDRVHWWAKRWEDHVSIVAGTYNAKPEGALLGLVGDQTMVLRTVFQIDGIGAKTGRAIAARYASVRDLCEASEKELRQIDGVGKSTAAKIVEYLNKRTVVRKGL